MGWEIGAVVAVGIVLSGVVVMALRQGAKAEDETEDLSQIPDSVPSFEPEPLAQSNPIPTGIRHRDSRGRFTK